MPPACRPVVCFAKYYTISNTSYRTTSNPMESYRMISVHRKYRNIHTSKYQYISISEYQNIEISQLSKHGNIEDPPFWARTARTHTSPRSSLKAISRKITDRHNIIHASARRYHAVSRQTNSGSSHAREKSTAPPLRTHEAVTWGAHRCLWKWPHQKKQSTNSTLSYICLSLIHI